MPDPNILSLRGGFNDFDPDSSLRADECVTADNVEFWDSPAGERRKGSSAITIDTALSTKAAITTIARHLPTTDEVDAQLWAWGVTAGVSSTLMYKDTSWHAVSFVDAPVLTSPSIYQMQFQTLHGKLFIAYNSGVDRLHVWDGTTLRRTGLAAPSAAPGVANTGGAGTYNGIRYFRVRYATYSGGVVTRRSEASAVTTFTPSGANDGAVVTKPSAISEGETHWEVEASVDNANFYQIAIVAVGTPTYTDNTTFTAGYAANGTLSANSGDYTLQHSGRYMIVDEDRLVFGGSFIDPTQASRIEWSPVFADPTGVSNDERTPQTTNNTLDLDSYEGGPLTGFGGPLNGIIYAFKWSHIYKLVRTGQAINAYDPRNVTKEVGAVPGSIVRGVDENGSAALYFLDPKVGPYRIGVGGLLWAGRYVWNTWQRINLDGAVVTRALYYPDKKQVHWWLAVDGSSTPTLRIILQTNDSVVTTEGIVRGWTRHDGASATALSACLFATNIESNTARSKKLVPFIAVGNTIQMMGSGTTDNGVAFTAHIISASQIPSTTQQSALLRTFGVRAGGVIMAADANATIQLRLVRDYGIEVSGYRTISAAPFSTEQPVIRLLDSLSLSECKSVQVEITDGANNASAWQVHEIGLEMRQEGTA